MSSKRPRSAYAIVRESPCWFSLWCRTARVASRTPNSCRRCVGGACGSPASSCIGLPRLSTCAVAARTCRTTHCQLTPSNALAAQPLDLSVSSASPRLPHPHPPRCLRRPTAQADGKGCIKYDHFSEAMVASDMEDGFIAPELREALDVARGRQPARGPLPRVAKAPRRRPAERNKASIASHAATL